MRSAKSFGDLVASWLGIDKNSPGSFRQTVGLIWLRQFVDVFRTCLDQVPACKIKWRDYLEVFIDFRLARCAENVFGRMFLECL